MSNLKITDLSSLSQSALDASADFLLAVDVSDTTMSASGTNVKIAPKTLVGGTINDLIQTWNSGATVFTGFKLNVTDTASDTDSSLMDLQVAGSSKFRIKKDGTIYVNGSAFSSGSWGNISGTLSDQTDLQNALDAKLSLSGGTINGPFTTSSGSLTTSTPYQFSQTWNNGATTFVGFYAQVTDTASSANSIIAAFGTNVNNLWTIRKDGALLLRGNAMNTGLYHGGGTTLAIRAPDNGRGIAVDGWAQRLIIDNLSQGVQWDSGAPLVMSSHVLHMRNSTNGQRINIYGTYTDSSNYRRIYIDSTTGGAFTLGVEGLGTGASGNTLTIPNDLYTNGFIELAASQRLRWASRSRIISWTDGNITLYNSGESDFFNLHFGGTTSSYPAIQRSGTTLKFRLANDSGDCPITAAAATFSGNISVNSTNLTSASLIFSTTSNPGLSSNANGLLIQHWGSNYHSFNYGIMRSARGAGSTGFAGIAGSPNVAGVDGPDSYFLNTALCTWEMYGVTGSNTNTFRVYQARTDSSNYHRWKVDWSSSTCRFGTERAGTGATGHMELWQNGGAIVTFNSGGKIFLNNRDITFGSWNGGEVSLRQTTAFSGVLDVVDALTHSTYRSMAMSQLIVGGAAGATTSRIKNTSGTMNFRLGNDSADCNITAAEALFSGSVKFSGSTSSEPMLKRSSTTIQARLADDSAFGSFQGKLTTETNYTAGAPTATGYLILYDATGTAYRVPAVLN